MKNYRLFLLSFVTVAFVFLSGFERPDDTNAFPVEKQRALITKKEAQSMSKEDSVKTKQKKTKNKPSVQSVKNNAHGDAELQKTLDISIPFEASENTGLKVGKNRRIPRESVSLFTAEKREKSKPVYLNGQMLMSQEPEMDKQKTLDGAGIVFTLKR
jgi:hypothetical protein